MALALDLSLEPGLQQRVSPQLIVHSALLELPAEELEERILEEADRNPALEVVRRSDEPAVPQPRATASVEDDEDAEPWWERLAAPVTGRAEILMQFRAAAPEHLHRVGETLISALDARGYLRGDLEELAAAAGATIDEAEQALRILQRLDPPGLGARDLAECLLLQLETIKEPVPPRTHEFIAKCLHGGPAEMMAAARRIGLTRTEIDTILRFIRERLHPYPAELTGDGGFEPYSAPAAQPDVIVTRENGRLVVSVPLSQRLEVRLDRLYQRIADQLRYRRNLADHEEDIRQKVRAARELVVLLQRRTETIAAVAEAIVKLQADYFITGDPETLRPLDQKDVARLTGLHESTVCRAVKAKHMQLPDGRLVPMDMFFDDAAPVRAALARIVRREPPEAPYSDKRLAEILTELGYPVARRTVTKYRAQMGIPPAHKRRRARPGRKGHVA